MALRQEALYASFKCLEKPLFNVLYRQLWQTQDCQDLIQDTCLRLWQRRERVDETTLDALVWTTALNLAKNRLRWRVLRRHEPLDEAVVALADDVSEEDFLAPRQLHAALRTLSRASQQVLLLSEFSGLSGSELASVLGIPPGTVASRKHASMARLKQLVSKQS